MRRIAKIDPKKAEIIEQALKDDAPDSAPTSDPKPSDIDLDDLLDKQTLILYRETKNLLIESSKGLLSPAASGSLERVMKLTAELRKRQKELLENLSDEELEKL